MENYNEKYSSGASGIGAPDYTSPAWLAGDLERQRVQRAQQEKNNASSTSSSSVSTDSSNVWAFIIAWIVLFYLTSQLTVVLAEMIFGKEANSPAPEFMIWLVTIFVFTLPTILVYAFRKIIPGLFYIVLIGGIVAVVVLALGFGSPQEINNYFSKPENNNISNQSKPTIQEIINDIKNDTKTKVYLPTGVAGSSLIPSEEESTKMRCESCATNLKPGSRVANKQIIISNCVPIKKKCNKIGIAW